jgi:F420H(2)-dependent quinone reductase
MLAAPIVEDDRLVLVASFGGDRHPAWYRNLDATVLAGLFPGGGDADGTGAGDQQRHEG